MSKNFKKFGNVLKSISFAQNKKHLQAQRMEEKVVYVVHSVDTEGPLYESLAETFVRIKNIFGFEIEPSNENLQKLQNAEFDLGGKEVQIQQMLSSGLLTYNDNYGKVGDMLERIGSKEFRMRVPDSYGNGWLYNWHCVDHMGYTDNPRRKDMGYHNIYDYYADFIKYTDAPDGIHWHFHPAHWSGASHICATSYIGDTRFLDIITRRVLERNWFPSVNRAGFHTERPDSHWLMEQWITFDISNQRTDKRDEQDDLNGGRLGDWRRAPSNWGVYNPSHDDYQVPGNCRRYIGRCLNVGTRMRLIDEAEVRRAFDEAAETGKALMAFTNHDFRDMTPDVVLMQDMLEKVSKDYPDIKFKYCDAREAFNRYIWGTYEEPKENILTARVEKGSSDTQVQLIIEASEPTFGPQPFLAIEIKGKRFLHDNLDFEEPFKKWTYTFDYQTVEWDEVEKIGIATNDKKGFNHILHLDPKNYTI